MKKILSLLLAVAMLAGCMLVMASCGQPTLKVGYTVYAPMNFYDNDGDVLDGDDGSGDFVGFDTELALLVAEKLGMKVQFVEIDWNNKYSELNSGAIDCIWNGFTSNSKDADGIERSEKVDFSYAYLDNAQCVVVKAADLAAYTSVESLAGKKGAAEGGSAGETYALSVTDSDKVVPADVQTDTFTELLAGAVDSALLTVCLPRISSVRVTMPPSRSSKLSRSRRRSTPSAARRVAILTTRSTMPLSSF
ncbi:MAG: transporter substrate-binding domain-containing protein [Clostridia bacterium]|nr:transporter substrate-binding domain-containing protein [Clostridia bacterium]